MTLLARWCLGEFERDKLLKAEPSKQNRSPWQVKSNADEFLPTLSSTKVEASGDNAADSPIKIKLLAQLTQELKTPLTSVIGMASVLHREVYGPLTVKQREYLEIIHNSGQNLINLVDEIVGLGVLSDRGPELNSTAIDIEMLCQKVINSLKDMAEQRQQTLTLSIEPGNRIWSIDKEKMRQAVYYLITSLMEISEPGGEVKIHVFKRSQALNISFGISHPWLGDDLREAKFYSQAVHKALKMNRQDTSRQVSISVMSANSHQILHSSALMSVINEQNTAQQNSNKIPRDLLSLLLCCHLTELHQGRVLIQGSLGSNHRYLLQFPHAKLDEG